MNEAHEPQVSKPRFSRRFIRNALIASLALNLLILGGLAGARWMRHHSAMGQLGRGLMGFAWSIDGERGDAIRAAVRSGRKTLKPLRQEIRKSRMAENDVLSAPVFDREAAKQALMATANQRSILNNAQMDVFLNVLEKMTAEEREKFVKRRKFWQRRSWHHRQREKKE